MSTRQLSSYLDRCSTNKQTCIEIWSRSPTIRRPLPFVGSTDDRQVGGQTRPNVGRWPRAESHLMEASEYIASAFAIRAVDGRSRGESVSDRQRRTCVHVTQTGNDATSLGLPNQPLAPGRNLSASTRSLNAGDVCHRLG